MGFAKPVALKPFAKGAFAPRLSEQVVKRVEVTMAFPLFHKDKICIYDKVTKFFPETSTYLNFLTHSLTFKDLINLGHENSG